MPPMLVDKVGWQPMADRICPRKVDTSEPAWVKWKMLSMKRSTSWPSSLSTYIALSLVEMLTIPSVDHMGQQREGRQQKKENSPVSMSKVISNQGIPMGAGGILTRLKSLRGMLSHVGIHSSWQILTLIALSGAVKKTCDFLVGMVEFCEINWVTMLPRVLILRERQVTLRRRILVTYLPITHCYTLSWATDRPYPDSPHALNPTIPICDDLHSIPVDMCINLAITRC